MLNVFYLTVFLIAIPFICWLEFILMYRISATKRYNRAESGHPCRIPFVIGHVLESQPLFFIFNIGFVYKISAHFIKLLLMLNFCIALNRKFHSTEYNAFSKSKESNKPSIFSVSRYSKTSSINLAFPRYICLLYMQFDFFN